MPSQQTLRASRAALVALTFCAFATDARTQEQSDPGVWSFVWENDFFAGTDKNYTNGVRLAYVSPPQGGDALARRLVDRALLLDGDEVVRFGAALGHSIFTPRDTTLEVAPPDQHPYAGWLYGEYSVYVDRGETMDTVALQLGVVGPSAQGEFVQNNFHELILSYEVRGWDDQLHDEPGVALIFERKERRLFELEFSEFALDVTPTWGFSLGNVRTQGNVGAMLRFGDDLQSDFGPPRVRPSLGGVSFFEPVDSFSWYLFAGVEGRAVARNIFLDGNTFQDSASVDKKNFVGDAQFGVVFQFENVQLGYTAVLRTEEFDGQDDPQRFGAVSLSVRY